MPQLHLGATDPGEGVSLRLLEGLGYPCRMGGPHQRQDLALREVVPSFQEVEGHAALPSLVRLAGAGLPIALLQHLQIAAPFQSPQRIRVWYRVQMPFLIVQIGIDAEHASLPIQGPPDGLHERIPRCHDPDQSLLSGLLGDQERDPGKSPDRGQSLLLQSRGELHCHRGRLEPLEGRAHHRDQL